MSRINSEDERIKFRIHTFVTSLKKWAFYATYTQKEYLHALLKTRSDDDIFNTLVKVFPTQITSITKWFQEIIGYSQSIGGGEYEEDMIMYVTHNLIKEFPQYTTAVETLIVDTYKILSVFMPQISQELEQLMPIFFKQLNAKIGLNYSRFISIYRAAKDLLNMVFNDDKLITYTGSMFGGNEHLMSYVSTLYQAYPNLDYDDLSKINSSLHPSKWIYQTFLGGDMIDFDIVSDKSKNIDLIKCQFEHWLSKKDPTEMTSETIGRGLKSMEDYLSLDIIDHLKSTIDLDLVNKLRMFNAIASGGKLDNPMMDNVNGSPLYPAISPSLDNIASDMDSSDMELPNGLSADPFKESARPHLPSEENLSAYNTNNDDPTKIDSDMNINDDIIKDDPILDAKDDPDMNLEDDSILDTKVDPKMNLKYDPDMNLEDDPILDTKVDPKMNLEDDPILDTKMNLEDDTIPDIEDPMVKLDASNIPAKSLISKPKSFDTIDHPIGNIDDDDYISAPNKNSTSSDMEETKKSTSDTKVNKNSPSSEMEENDSPQETKVNKDYPSSEMEETKDSPQETKVKARYRTKVFAKYIDQSLIIPENHKIAWDLVKVTYPGAQVTQIQFPKNTNIPALPLLLMPEKWGGICIRGLETSDITTHNDIIHRSANLVSIILGFYSKNLFSLKYDYDKWFDNWTQVISLHPIYINIETTDPVRILVHLFNNRLIVTTKKWMSEPTIKYHTVTVIDTSNNLLSNMANSLDWSIVTNANPDDVKEMIDQAQLDINVKDVKTKVYQRYVHGFIEYSHMDALISDQKAFIPWIGNNPTYVAGNVVEWEYIEDGDVSINIPVSRHDSKKSLLLPLLFPSKFNNNYLKKEYDIYFNVDKFPKGSQGITYVAALWLSRLDHKDDPGFMSLDKGFNAWFENWHYVMEYSEKYKLYRSILFDPVRVLIRYLYDQYQNNNRVAMSIVKMSNQLKEVDNLKLEWKYTIKLNYGTIVKRNPINGFNYNNRKITGKTILQLMSSHTTFDTIKMIVKTMFGRKLTINSPTHIMETIQHELEKYMANTSEWGMYSKIKFSNPIIIMAMIHLRENTNDESLVRYTKDYIYRQCEHVLANVGGYIAEDGYGSEEDMDEDNMEEEEEDGGKGGDGELIRPNVWNPDDPRDENNVLDYGGILKIIGWDEDDINTSNILHIPDAIAKHLQTIDDVRSPSYRKETQSLITAFHSSANPDRFKEQVYNKIQPSVINLYAHWNHVPIIEYIINCIKGAPWDREIAHIKMAQSDIPLSTMSFPEKFNNNIFIWMDVMNRLVVVHSNNLQEPKEAKIMDYPPIKPTVSKESTIIPSAFFASSWLYDYTSKSIKAVVVVILLIILLASLGIAVYLVYTRNKKPTPVYQV